MTQPIGQIIKRLRKAKNMTQDELAEQLNISAQAISKWENGTSMPDISQIVPLASVFGVNTDTLFGLNESSPDQEAIRIIDEAERIQTYGRKESYLQAYDMLQEGLRRYPNHQALLYQSVHLGASLAMPENGWLYAPDRAEEIASETFRQAHFILSSSKDVNCIMRTRQVLIYLYCARGEYDLAMQHAREFPERSDFTLSSHIALIHEAKGEYAKATRSLCTYIGYSLQALEDHTARLGQNFLDCGKTEEAIRVYETFFAVMREIFGECPPPYHDFDSGDCHLLLARAYLAAGRQDDALLQTEEAVHYWLKLLNADTDPIAWSSMMTSPLVSEKYWNIFIPKAIIRQKLLDKLNAPEIQGLKEHPRILALRELVENLPEQP